jgi:hypothetical protein
MENIFTAMAKYFALSANIWLRKQNTFAVANLI